MFSEDDQSRGKVNLSSLIENRDVNICTVFDGHIQITHKGNKTHNFGSLKQSDSTERHSYSEMRPSKGTLKSRMGNSLVVDTFMKKK